MPDYEKYSEGDDPYAEHRHMRRVAFFAVVVSTVAVMATVITLPMVYNYVQSLQTHMMAELDFCKVHKTYFCFSNAYVKYIQNFQFCGSKIFTSVIVPI